MDTNFITPIQTMNSISDITKSPRTAGNDGNNIFKDIFSTMMNDVTNTQNTLSQQQYLLTTGQIDDAHSVPLAASEAQLSIDMLVQMRNKALDAYNELMRTNL